MNLRLILFLLITSMPTDGATTEDQPYLDIQSTAYSEPITIKSILDQWQPPFHGGNKVLAYAQIETGVRRNNWKLGILERFDYNLLLSPETARLIYLIKNHLPLDAGNNYELQVKAQSNYSHGLRLSYQHQATANIKIGLAAAYLKNKNFMAGKIQGNTKIVAEKEYVFQFDTDYFYSHDTLFGRRLELPLGRGYSIDFSLDWQINKRIKTHLNVIDLIGEMFWHDAPSTVATATSDTQSVDNEGYLLYKPAISGIEKNSYFKQTLPKKIFFSMQYNLTNRLFLLSKFEDFGLIYFASIGAEWCHQFNTCFQGLYNTTAKSLAFRYQRNNMVFELSSDKIQLQQARYLSFHLSFNQVF